MTSERGATSARDLSVTELGEQAPDVAVDRLAPDLFARPEVTATQTPSIWCPRRRVERDQTPFAVPTTPTGLPAGPVCLNQSTAARTSSTS